MSMGNLPYLATVESPHTVTNFWKRLHQEMKDPLIPFDFYPAFEKIAVISSSTTLKQNIEHLMLLNLKFLLNQLPELNFVTLKFHMEFFQEVVQHEPLNRMNSYNVAVTVGPNIFRPRVSTCKDIVNVGIFYDLLIKMIDRNAELFDKETSYADLIKRWGAKVPRTISL